jgi:hypothetical protein
MATERTFSVQVKILSSVDAPITDKVVAETMLGMEVAFNSQPTPFRVHVGKFGTLKELTEDKDGD